LHYFENKKKRTETGWFVCALAARFAAAVIVAS